MAAKIDPELGDAFRRRIMHPLLIATTLIVGLAIGGLLLVTRHGDAVSIERQIHEAETVVHGSIDELARSQEIAAVWDEAALQMEKSHPDLNWLDDNVGIWLFKMFDHDQVYILDAKDRPVYAAIAGQRTDVSRFKSISGTVQHFADAVRGRIVDQNNRHERLPRLPLNPASTVKTGPAAIHATDLTWINERPATISVMKIVSHTRSARETPGRESLLVSVRFLDGNFLNELATRNLLTGARISPSMDTKQGEQSFALVSDHGHVGYFSWRPELPGSRMRGYLATMLGVLALLIGLIMGLLSRFLYLAMREQHEARSQLETTVFELAASEAQAQHLAFHDVLTGLPNRALFHDRIEQTLAHLRKSNRMALLMLDLDRFKRVNDTLGHVAGDALIREFAARLLALLDTRATVARLGGDEFVIIVANIDAKAEIHELCDRILKAAEEPFQVLGTHVHIGVSIGVVFAPDAGADRLELMRKVDIALYSAKREGRDCFRVFSSEMDDSVRFRSEIEDELRAALQTSTQLRVFYQPQVGSAGQQIVGFEALVRWEHPTRGLLTPETFVQIAEETGLISQLGEWVLKEACSVAKRWPGLFVGVNLSAAQFRTPGFAQRLIGIVREAAVHPSQLELEVTETVLLQDDELVTNALVQFRKAGFRIALDDFGTGYSSLSHLHRFEVDKIKIDRTFVQNLGKLDSTAIVNAVVNLGHAMGLEVTAEGVETEDQLIFLLAAGCDVMQGHLFSRAVPEAALAQFIRDQLDPRLAA